MILPEGSIQVDNIRPSTDPCGDNMANFCVHGADIVNLTENDLINMTVQSHVETNGCFIRLGAYCVLYRRLKLPCV